MNQQLIVIFNEQLAPLFFVGSKPDLFLQATGYSTKPEEIKLNKVIESLKVKPPRIKVESINQAGLKVDRAEVEAGSKNYLAAVAEELRIAGFMAKIIPTAIKNLLIYISLKATFEQRQKIMGELTNVPADIEPEAAEELLGILLDIDRYKADNKP